MAVFLTARWRDLLMINYEVTPALLQPLAPAGTELDTHDGATLMSVVGLLFRNTRVGGIPIPLHRHFEELNLRFYVRRQVDGERRRGVVFIKELVPRAAVAWVARRIYGENYAALPMHHSRTARAGSQQQRLSYSWLADRTVHTIAATFSKTPHLPADDSREAFISEHSWGYTRRPDGSTLQYQVDHPRWPVRQVDDLEIDADWRAIYERPLAEALQSEPTSAFVAEGSAVTVYRGERI